MQSALRVLAALSVLSAAAIAPAAAAVSPAVSPAAAPASAPAAVMAAAAADELTTPCGPTVEYRAWDWWRTTTNPSLARPVASASVAERWQWRTDVNTLWRGDTRETVEEIFETGFTPRGDEVTPLAEYIVKGGGQNSAHLSTSCEKWVAQKFATYGSAKTGWVYEIYAPGGIDVNATARLNDYNSPYLWNKEIDFPGGVKGRYIKGACKFRLTYTDPETKVSTFEELGCKNNTAFAPYETDAAALAAAAR
ncbi:scabin-related ADP-ribosyltransferase [Streptomyces sp. 4.24]|uniref:scabin-related ADP-ribosyltransferase n=1 Tax=Streptomyces tritrimontium TaxID=3406573 RepID=UPI003BB4A560